MKNKNLLFTRIVLAFILVVAVERFCHKQTHGFTLLKIASQSPLSSIDDSASLTQDRKAELEAILNEPFTFLNSGGQCYAFLSQDGKTILKLFKQHHLRAWHLLKRISLPGFLEEYRQKILEKKIHYSSLFFESCKISYEEFTQRTGLIYLHLNRTDCFKKKLQIVDPLGIAHYIDLDTTDFAIQTKAELSHQRFKKLIKNNDLNTARQCIDSIIDLICERCQKGIADRDPNIRTNIGFLDNHAIEIDLGSFTKNPHLKSPDQYMSELNKSALKLHRWLLKQNAELAVYLLQRMHQEEDRQKELPSTSLNTVNVPQGSFLGG